MSNPNRRLTDYLTVFQIVDNNLCIIYYVGIPAKFQILFVYEPKVFNGLTGWKLHKFYLLTLFQNIVNK